LALIFLSSKTSNKNLVFAKSEWEYYLKYILYLKIKKMIDVIKNLEALGLVIPEPPKPVAEYASFVVSNSFIFISGQLPLCNGKLMYVGKAGKDHDVETTGDAMRLCALNILAQLSRALNNDYTRIKQCVRLGGFINSIDTFSEQSKCMNNASQVMLAAFGEKIGLHARTTVSVNSLPQGSLCEIEALFSLV
jgi:enamine deaminase RidA (YjgF/YER057c/UK114 family)